MKIFKYEIPIEDEFVLELPMYSKILSFQVQNEKPFIWVLVDPVNFLEKHYFLLRGTGHDINYNPDCIKYIGTVQMADGALVWHLFENLV